MTYVSDLKADRFDASVVYATFDNRKRDDFKPYVLKSYDRGNNWVSIAANLPENGTVHTIEQDPEVPGLLFVGTEFGFYFSVDGGEAWTELTSGLPTISVRDMVIQEDQNDLVLATFGRGFYIMDDYTPLRELAVEQALLEKEAHIFPVEDALMYIQTGGKYGQGSTFFSSKNPEFGATFTYFLKEVPKTLKAERQEQEKELFENKQPIPQPTRDQLRLEENEEAPYLVFAIRDASGEGVRKLYTKASEGLSRIHWDLRYSSTNPVRAVSEPGEKVESSSGSTLAMPGEYSVELYLVARGEVSQLAEAVPFKAKLLNQSTLPAKDPKAVVDFQKEVSELSRVMSGTRQMAREQQVKLNTIREAIKQTPGTGSGMLIDVLALQDELDNILYKLDGPPAKASWEELPPMEMPLNRRLSVMVRTHWSSTAGLTKTETDQLEILREEFPPVLDQLKEVVTGIEKVEAKLEELKAPWTPGRMPELN
jgi:hypothetical protein